MSFDSPRCRYCNYLPEGEYLCDPTDSNACQPCKKLSEVEEKVKEIRMMLVGLESERQKLKTQVNQYHDWLIHRLPPEISGEIFVLCVPRCDFNNLPPKSSACAPLIISAVCKRWKDIAQSTPRLWNTLPLYSNTQTIYSALPGLSFVRNWINRAGQLPLSIILGKFKGQEDKAAQILDLLSLYSARWRELRYEGPLSLCSHFPSKPQSLLALRTLHLENTNLISHSGPTINLYPKQLDVLSIIGIRLSSVKFEWERLTQLTMGHIPISDYLEALRKAPDLIKCSLLPYVYEPDGHPNTPRHPTIHSGLQELEIIDPSFEKVVNELSCPSLKSLTLNGDECHYSEDPFLIADFFKRSKCSLENLSITTECPYLSEWDLTTIFHEIPTLQHLTLRIQHLGGAFGLESLFKVLAQISVIEGIEYPQYLPNLRSLSLKIDKFSAWTMVPKIFGKFEASPPAHQIHRHALEAMTISLIPYYSGDQDLKVAENIDVDTLRKILWLREAGVNFRIHFGQKPVDLISRAVKRHGISLS